MQRPASCPCLPFSVLLNAPSHRLRCGPALRCSIATVISGNPTLWKIWSGRWGSNPRPVAWEATALPLSYTRDPRSLSITPNRIWWNFRVMRPGGASRPASRGALWRRPRPLLCQTPGIEGVINAAEIYCVFAVLGRSVAHRLVYGGKEARLRIGTLFEE